MSGLTTTPTLIGSVLVTFFCLFPSDNDNGNDEDDDNDEMKNVINSPLVFSIPDLFL